MEPTKKVAIVTGAAHGIGRACALRLVASGMDVVAVDLSDSAETIAAASGPGTCTAVQCDVADPDQVASLKAEVEQRHGRCDVLLNNVGIYPASPFNELSYEVFRHVMAVNVDSMFLLATAFGGGMREAGWGRIVNIGSSITFSHSRDLLPYITSKGAVHALTRALANELSPDGVTVNAIAPSIVATEGRRGVFIDGRTSEEEHDFVVSLQSIKRKSVPEDIANAFAFLVSDEADFITGHILHVSGGIVRSGA